LIAAGGMGNIFGARIYIGSQVIFFSLLGMDDIAF